MKIKTFTVCFAAVAILFLLADPAIAIRIDAVINGSDAIFLSGRTDVEIPDASEPWTEGTHLIRHAGMTPEEIKETMPSSISVSSGDVIRVADPAIGGINFFNGYGPPFFGPSGNGTGGSNLTSLDGISGYMGPQGALTGVFLDDSIPDSGPAPVTLDFTPVGFGTDFLTLSPELGQIFYIGDGITGSGDYQTFIAPADSTRLFLGIPDGFGFVGAPGAYDDNDGSYRVSIGINETPSIPEPANLALFGIAIIWLAGSRKKFYNQVL